MRYGWVVLLELAAPAQSIRKILAESVKRMLLEERIGAKVHPTARPIALQNSGGTSPECFHSKTKKEKKNKPSCSPNRYKFSTKLSEIFRW